MSRTETQLLMADTDMSDVSDEKDGQQQQQQQQAPAKLQRKPSLFRALTSPGLRKEAALNSAAASHGNSNGSGASGLKGNLGSIRRRPHLGSIRQRLSGVFSSPDTPRVKKEEDPVDEDFYYRPVPFSLTSGECKTIYMMRNAEDLIEVRDADKLHAIYVTNILGKLDKKSMPEAVIIRSTEHDESKAKSPVAAYRVGDELFCQIKGLTPIRFYKGKPDCVLKVDCFETSQVVRPQPGSRALSTLSVNTTTQAPVNDKRRVPAQSNAAEIEKEGDVKVLKYAWKHTSVCGKGGLKLVDLLDGEILAYYEHIRTGGRAFAKIKLQGSGLHAMKLVVATSLALRARSSLPEGSEARATEMVKEASVQLQQELRQQQPQQQPQSSSQAVPPVPHIAPRWQSPEKPKQTTGTDHVPVSAAAEQALFSVAPPLAKV